MSVSQRERRLLTLLAVVAVVAGGRWLWQLAAAPAAAPGSVVAAARAPQGARRGGRVAVEVDRVVELRTDRLDPAPHDLTVGRDLFRFKPPPPPPPPPGPSPEELAQRRREAEERAARPRVPQPPPIDLDYLGSFGPDGARIAVFTDRAGNILNAHEGDVLERAFRVTHIGFESVDIEFVDFPAAPAQRLALAE